LLVDGSEYVGDVTECRIEDVIYYDVSDFASVDDYRINAWTVDGRFENARASSLAEVAARMAAFDTEPWVYDPVLRVIRGGNPSRQYSALVLRSSTITRGVPVESSLADGTSIDLVAGTYQLSIVDLDGCTANWTLEVGCSTNNPPTLDTIYADIGVGFADTLCVPVDQLTGPLDLVFNICEDASGEQVVVTQLDSTCIRYEGFELGLDTVCYVACDLNGVCDTTIIIIEAIDPLDYLYPIANPDMDTMSMNATARVPILDNDTIRGDLRTLEVIQYPLNGDAQISNNELLYIADPLFCGVDSLIYELCNQHGCDTAVVEILVECDELIIFSGFSPNFDDVNETFTVLGIEQFPDNRMEVFNRYGNIVFEMDSYDNTWEGTYFDGEELPEGTYFYIFEDGRGRTYTGYVYLRR